MVRSARIGFGSAKALSTTPQYYLDRSKTADTAREIRASWRNKPGRSGQAGLQLHPPISRQRDTETRCRGHTTGQTPYESGEQSERNPGKYIHRTGGYPRRTPADKARICFPASYHRPVLRGLFQSDSPLFHDHS